MATKYKTMTKKSDIKKETPKKGRSLIQKVFGGGKDEESKGNDPAPEKKDKEEVKLEEFNEPAPKPTGNAFKDAIAMSAWRTKKNQVAIRNKAKLAENEREHIYPTVKFDEEAGRDEGQGGSEDPDQSN